jgi:hypothetical protein
MRLFRQNVRTGKPQMESQLGSQIAIRDTANPVRTE